LVKVLLEQNELRLVEQGQMEEGVYTLQLKKKGEKEGAVLLVVITRKM